MTTPEYKTSFTAGGLFQREALKIAQRYQVLGNWAAVRADALKTNLLQTRTRSSSVRLLREASQRVQCLTPGQLGLLLTGSRPEQNQLLWLAACKQYRLIAEFAREVVREKFLRLDLDLSLRDYDIFFNAKAEWHADLDGLTGTTRKKLRQVLFRMLREADVQISMDGKGRALDNIFTERLWRTIKYEEVYLKEYTCPRDAHQGLTAYLAFYNQERPHQSLGYRTPASADSLSSAHFILIC